MTDTILDEAAVAAAWDRNADIWTQEVRSGLDLYRELYTFPAFLDFMPPIAGKRVIDLGCGEGSNTRRFARLGGVMTGIDLSSGMIRRAREQEKDEPLGIVYEIASFGDLAPFADGAFDAALSTMALMDGPDLSASMQAASRVLKLGGALCFSVLHPCFITPAIAWLADEAGGHLGLRVGQYFEREPFVEHWRFSRRDGGEQKTGAPKFEVPRFPRTLSDYINAVSEAGFRIVRIEEPRPSEEMARKHDWLKRWYRHAPLVLFILAVKAPASE
ncbi:class I SAM-dependent methyltransferase [Microvirga lotononidis]|uniref:Methyltransferase family protein n=1 Tax=Microvirga lotononidis TaxID=864069 RepID=I4YXR5_9HYPH|nr:class I SAM-dependent methyltransferase [Microvirga lotononidis]EIM28757.1 methyltransferase family protein [Microvirga lotononidis]WQO25508.1 class I SAM-dependent methyltransferase [Microvirga lotononidis]